MKIDKVLTLFVTGSLNGESILTESGLVIMIGLVVVFATLIVLTAIFWLFGRASSYREKPATSKPDAEEHKETESLLVAAPLPVKPSIQSGISEEVVAVIAAAIASMTPEGTGYAIRSVRRARGERPVWAAAGVAENTRPF
jgi:sodium pump decarboxylase gamma subunit